MPSPLEWQDSIRSEGFPLEMHTDFDIDKFRGFLPCKLSGKFAGFEYFSHPLVRSEHEELEDIEVPPDFDFWVEFVTHGGNKYDSVAWYVAASSLCKITCGLLLDPQGGDFFKGGDAIALAKAEIAKLEAALRPSGSHDEVTWRISVGSALRSSFRQATGPSRPGADWVVELKGDRESKKVLVRIFSDEVVGLTTAQEASVAARYVADLLESGWTPEEYRGQPGELTVSPQPNLQKPKIKAPAKPWWRFW
jgi:hypothetical protein